MQAKNTFAKQEDEAKVEGHFIYLIVVNINAWRTEFLLCAIFIYAFL